MDWLAFIAANSGAITINGTDAYVAAPVAGFKVMDDATVIDHIYVNGGSEDIKDTLIVGTSTDPIKAGTIIRPLDGAVITSLKLATAGEINAVIDSSNDQ